MSKTAIFQIPISNLYHRYVRMNIDQLRTDVTHIDSLTNDYVVFYFYFFKLMTGNENT